MRRIDPPKQYYGMATEKYAKSLVDPWMLPYRDKLSVMQSAIINPMVITAEDIINNDFDITKKVLYPQTTYIDEPHIYYKHNSNITITNIDSIKLDGIPLSQVYKIKETDSSFLDMEYDTLVPLMNQEFNLNNDYGFGVIGYGDQQGNIIRATIWHIPASTPYIFVANYAKAISDGIPDGEISVDIMSKKFNQDQVMLRGSSQSIDIYETVQREVSSNENYIPAVLLNGNTDDLVINSNKGILPDYYIVYPAEQKPYKLNCDFNENGIVDEEDYNLMVAAIGKDYTSVDPIEWNNVWTYFDLNKDGVIDKSDMNMFLAFYPSSTYPDNTIAVIRKRGTYTIIEKVMKQNMCAINTFCTGSNGGVREVRNYSDDPLIKGQFPSHAVDVTYDSRADIYYYSSDKEKGVIGVKFNSAGWIMERKKFTLGSYYQWNVRGIKWKDGYIYLLIVLKGKCKILRFDTLSTYEFMYDHVIDIECTFVDPTFLTINDEDRFVIGDGNKIYIMKNIYKRVMLKEGSILLLSHPLYDWECYEGEGIFSYGPISTGIPTGIMTGVPSGIPFAPYKLWNVFDEYALGTGLERLPGEDNDSLLYRIMSVFRRPPGVNQLGLLNGLQRDFALYYYTPTKGNYTLRFNPNPNRIRDLEIYADDVKVDIGDIVKNGDNWYSFYDRTNKLIIELRDTNIVDIDQPLENIKTVDVIYWTLDSDGNDISIHDKWDNFDFIAKKTEEAYVTIETLADNDYLLDPANGYFTQDGKITEKLITVINKVDNYNNDRWGNAVTDESFYDMTSYDGNVTVVPTKYDTCPTDELVIVPGIGWNDDLKHSSIESDLIRRSVNTADEEWHPIINPGFFYIQEKEYYCFNDKSMFIVTGTIDLSTIEDISPAYNTYIDGLRKSTSPVDEIDPGVEDKDFILFDFDYAFQLDCYPDKDSPLILTEILIPFWEPTGFIYNYDIENGVMTGTWVPIKNGEATTEDETVDITMIFGVTRKYSESIYIPDLLNMENIHDRFSKTINYCDDGYIYMTGIPNRSGILYEALMNETITLEDLEDKYFANDVLLDGIINDINKMIPIHLTITDIGQTIFDIGMRVIKNENTLLVINGLMYWYGSVYEIESNTLTFMPDYAMFSIGPNDHVTLYVWNDLLSYLANYMYPSDLYWVNGIGLVGKGNGARVLPYNLFTYNPYFNCIEVYKDGKYILNYESEQSKFAADDVDVNPFNTSFSDGYLLIEDETLSTVIQESNKIMSLIITSRKAKLSDGESSPCVAISLTNSNRPISKELQLDIYRIFEDDVGDLDIIERYIVDENYEYVKFNREIIGTIKEDDISVHRPCFIWNDAIIIKQKAYLIVDGNKTLSTMITTDITGSKPFDIYAPDVINTSCVVKIRIKEGTKSFIHYIPLFPSSTDYKYMSIQDNSSITRHIEYVNAIGIDSITSGNTNMTCPTDARVYNAVDYFRWMETGFITTSEPNKISIRDVTIASNIVTYYFDTNIIGEYILETQEIDYNEILLNKYFIYMV